MDSRATGEQVHTPLRSTETWVHEVLEPDQLSTAKQHLGRRRLSRGTTTMPQHTLNPVNEALIHTYLDIATNTDDMERFSHLIAQDFVWVMMPTGHTFTGYAQVSTLAKLAEGTRRHNDEYKVKILNWWTDGEQFCVEYQHGALIQRLPIRGRINICLVCHMREGKFDRIHEYVHAHGFWFKLVMSLGLRALPVLVNRKVSQQTRGGK